ncbi:Hypothetical protein A7982_04683 [Minicystis rosea]|nr:Hypothetical protein A7982_04683 [Minicystis rosea]
MHEAITRHTRRFLRLVTIAVALSTSLGCRTSKPSSLGSGWEALVVAPANLTLGAHDARAVSGTAAVLCLHARWGKSPFVTEYSYGQFVAEISPALTPGTITRFAAGSPPGMYQEGGMVLVYDGRVLEGTIQVVWSDATSVDLAVDLMVKSPSLDRAGMGAIPLRGIVKATRESNVERCGGR